ncbi:DUF1702 family protein [Parasphingorhabdus sp.]|uniref:DUF1702 family protein n=1 Tax=Parasphingorhabdus sp. TaxID=2709688 RepID=UPI003593C6F6
MEQRAMTGTVEIQPLAGQADRLRPPPAVIRKFLALDPRRVEFRVRGFDLADKSHEERLESIGKAFLRGYNLTLTAQSFGQFRQAMAQETDLLRGFFIEGGAMGSALVDSLPFRKPMLPRYLQLFGEQYPILIHAGVGLTISKLSWREKGILAELDPFYRWLAYDGLGYHNMYFEPEKTLTGPKRALEGYASRAYDQGAGRGIWFTSGADVGKAAATIATMATDRQPDLWAGVGLALCYAGPAGAQAFLDAKRLAGPCAADLATGVAIACTARVKDQSLLPETREAILSLWEKTPEALAERVEALRQSIPASAVADGTAYAAWRADIARDFSGQ